MNRALWISASGMESQQVLTNTIANNMANVNTAGYKRSIVHFEDLLYDTVHAPGAANSSAESSVGIELGNGVRTASVAKDFSQGTLKTSSSSLDLAIEGDGFFEIQMPDGSSGYSRAGSFHMNANGEIVTANGYRVLGTPTLDTKATSIDIDRDGTVSVVVDGTSTEKGRISVVRFPNPEGLRSLGQSTYSETPASGSPRRGAPGADGSGTISQYSLESSNVQIINEMVDMIAAQRAYELLSKNIRASDEMLRTVNNMR